MELASAFKALLSSIEPTDQHVANAKAAHETVRQQLRTDSEFKEAHKETFLSGSYARHTAINDINDVDVSCVVDIDRYNTPAELVLAWTESILAKYYKVFAFMAPALPGSQSIAGSAEACAFAMAVREQLGALLKKNGVRNTRLFFYGQQALAIFLGQQLTSVGKVQLFEYQDPGYVPSVLLST